MTRRSQQSGRLIRRVGLLATALSVTSTGATGQTPALAWLPLPPLPTAVRSPAAATDGSRVYVVGGSTHAGRTDAMQILELSTRGWSQGPSLPEPTDWGSAVWAGGALHFLGGVTGESSATTQHLVYEPRGTEWRRAEPLPTRLAGAAAAAVGARIYVFAGNSGGQPAHTAATHVFDTRTGNWTTGRAVPDPRINWAGAAGEGRVYLVGGGTPGLGTSDEILEYDAGRDAWVEVGLLEQPREAHGVAFASGLVCVFGGRLAARGNFSTPFFDVTCLDPARWTRVAAPRLPRALQELAAVSLPGAVLTLGGADGSRAPVTDVWLLRIR